MDQAAGIDPYDAYPYTGITIPYTSPAHLALCSRWFGGPGPSLERFALAELGCGDGGNLLPLAFYRPECTFLGIDRSRTALQRARNHASRLGLDNVTFVGGDVTDLSPEEFGPYEYVIAHGLYSWVPDEARAAISAFCRDTLAADGLAYISYNAQPGWSTRQLVRDTLRRSRHVRAADIADKANMAIEAATRLLEDIPASRVASAVVLADELARVRDGTPWYVFHEYLTDTNEGFWLRDFVERARDNGLAYVADAHFCRWEGQVPPELRSSVAARKLDLIDEEERVDLLGHRYFRASILSHTHAGRPQVSHHEVIEHAHIAASLRPQLESVNLDERVVEHYVGPVGNEITVDSSIGKAAIALLAEDWPRAVPFEQLYVRSLSVLAQHDRPAPSDGRRDLLDAITVLFEAGQMDLRLREPNYCSEAKEYPTAHRLARWEAECRDALTTPHHLTVAFDDDTMSLVRSMDGSRSRSDLQQMFGSEFVERTLPILWRCGLLADRH